MKNWRSLVAKLVVTSSVGAGAALSSCSASDEGAPNVSADGGSLQGDGAVGAGADGAHPSNGSDAGPDARGRAPSLVAVKELLRASVVSRTPTGGFVLAGMAGAGPHGGTPASLPEFALAELSPDGQVKWARSIMPGADPDASASTRTSASAVAIRTDGAGNVYVRGHTPVPFPGLVEQSYNGLDDFFAKMDPTGQFVWARQVGPGVLGQLASYFFGALDDAGNAYLGHYAYSGGNKWQIAKHGPTGTPAYDIELTPPGGTKRGDYEMGTTDKDGNSYLLELITEMGAPSSWLLQKLTPAGVVSWAKSPVGLDACDRSGAGVNAFRTAPNGAALYVPLGECFAKYDSNGELVWKQTVPAGKHALAISTDGSALYLYTETDSFAGPVTRYDADGHAGAPIPMKSVWPEFDVDSTNSTLVFVASDGGSLFKVPASGGEPVRFVGFTGR